MHLSNGRASPVRTVKLTRAFLAMVTFSSWMVNVRTSFFTVRIPVCNRSGLTLRSVGSSGILRPVRCVRGVCCLPTCAQGSSVLLQGMLGVVLFWHYGCSLESCAYGRCLLCLTFPLMSTRLGLRRCAYHWTRPLGGGRWRH